MIKVLRKPTLKKPMQLHLTFPKLVLLLKQFYLAQQSGTQPVQYCLSSSANLGDILVTMSGGAIGI